MPTPGPVTLHLRPLADLTARTRPDILREMLPRYEAEKARIVATDICKWDIHELASLDLRIIRCRRLLRAA